MEKLADLVGKHPSPSELSRELEWVRCVLTITKVSSLHLVKEAAAAPAL